MKPDVLFWFYKDFEICQQRLQKLRELNEGIKIFALFGGSLSEAEKAREAVQKLVNDFYVYPYEKEPVWKWKHGDQMIATWYAERGQYLGWETIFVMQWDMLILDSLENLFSKLQPQEILLSGFRPISTVSSWWGWANSDNEDIGLFKEVLHDQFNYEGNLFVCLFIVVCLPRIFLEKYVSAGSPEVGFLEYKIPTMARVFNIPICEDSNFEPWWAANPATRKAPISQRSLNAVGQEIPLSVILHELAKTDGKRLFHPVFNTLPTWVDKTNWMKKKYLAEMLSKSLQLLEAVPRKLNRLKDSANKFIGQQ